MLTRTVELVVSTNSSGKAWYAHRFLRNRKIPFRMLFPASPRSKELRALFNDKDDYKVYPLVVVSEHEDLNQEDRIIFKAPQVGVAKLYKVIRKYFYGDEAE